jgi:hypothetical protein
MSIFEFWNFGRIMAIKPMVRRGSKLGFNISKKFLIDRVQLPLSCRILEFCDFGQSLH